MCLFPVDKMELNDSESTTGYKCQMCGRSYKYKHGRSAHQRYECGRSAMFECHLCPYKAKQKSNLKSHLLNRHLGQF